MQGTCHTFAMYLVLEGLVDQTNRTSEIFYLKIYRISVNFSLFYTKLSYAVNHFDVKSCVLEYRKGTA